ncbi:unnamed protein product, partial [Didymodactylos carnosus]
MKACQKRGLLMLNNEFQSVIRHHQSILHSLQEQLSELNRENPLVYTNLLVDAIEERRQAMIQRFFRIHQYKLKSFFDEAPP